MESPDAVTVFPVPTFLLSNVMEVADKVTESPETTLLKDNVPVAAVAPSYTLSFADKDGVTERAVMLAVPVAEDVTE